MSEKVINQALAFLSKKIDELKAAVLSKSVTIDVGESVSAIGKDIAAPIEAGLDTLAAAIANQTAVLNNKKAEDVVTELKKLQYELRNKRMDVTVEGQKISVEPVVAAIREMSKSLANKKQDNADVVKALGELKAAFKAIKFEAQPTDMSGLLIGMAALEKKLENIAAAVKANAPEKIGEKIDAMDAVFKGLKPKDSVKFDETQMRGLMSALTSGRGGAGGNKSATQWDVVQIPLAVADTEYSYTFPANTVSWTMKLRGTTAKFYYASEAGKLPVSGDNTAYMTVPANGTRSQDNVEYGGKIMYFETNVTDQVVELEVFTM